MNIIIKPYNAKEGLLYFKPDTALNRDWTPLYLPDPIKKVEARELFCVKIERAGKGISLPFASRYFSKGSYGVSIRAVDAENPYFTAGWACEAVDYSFYQMPAETLVEPELIEEFCNYISEITKIISLRTGDIVAIETGASATLSIDDAELIPCSSYGRGVGELSKSLPDTSPLSGIRHCTLRDFQHLNPVEIIF